MAQATPKPRQPKVEYFMALTLAVSVSASHGCRVSERLVAVDVPGGTTEQRMAIAQQFVSSHQEWPFDRVRSRYPGLSDGELTSLRLRWRATSFTSLRDHSVRVKVVILLSARGSVPDEVLAYGSSEITDALEHTIRAPRE
jgi:hypothetical protein